MAGRTSVQNGNGILNFGTLKQLELVVAGVGNNLLVLIVHHERQGGFAILGDHSPRPSGQ